MKTWILTFNRPAALNRQIATFAPWSDVHIFSNHPEVMLTGEHNAMYQNGKLPILYNSLSDPEATSYCARSWNNIFLKAFKDADELLCVQDDTMVTNPEGLKNLILANRDRYDLIWGPGGDQFFYVKKKVLQTVGWFDERYLGCYCGDADWLKRIWQQCDHNRLSVFETHDWGFVHNDIGLGNYFRWDIQSKAIDPSYVNQHHEIEGVVGASTNRILDYSQAFYAMKWNQRLNGTGPITQDYFTDPGSLIEEIDWYPWFTEKYLKVTR